MQTSEILDRLDGVRETGGGKWMARCPAHDDRRASLSIGIGEDGRTLLRCFAKCSTEAILDKLGLRPSDLFAESGNGRPLRWDSVIGGSDRSPGSSTNGSGRSTSTSSSNGKPAGKGRGHSTAKAALSALERQHGKRSRLWKYFDRNGEPVGLVVRWDTPEGKDVRPISRIGDRWQVKAMPAPRPLYGLTGLPDAGPIHVVEGELCTDAARSLGFPAVTSSGGSAAAGKSDWEPLRDREVILTPDADQAGEKYIADVAAILKPLGATLRVLRLPGLKPDSGEDLIDWLDRGGDGDQLRELVAAAEGFDPAGQAADKPTPAPTLKWKPYPLDEHPEPIKTYVRRTADSIGCDPAFVATAILPALASAIGTSRVVLLKPGWVEPSVLWGACVGDSGDGKSPAIDAATKHLRRRQAVAIDDYRRQREEFDREQEAYELDYSDWKRSGRKKGDPPPIEPVAPICERFLVSDTTIEGLAALLETSPRGLLLHRDELSGWLSSFDRYAGKSKGTSADASHWLAIHGSRDLLVDRKTGDRKTIFVRRAAVSLTGGIQPGILARSLSGEHTESGLSARLLVAMPPRRVKGWTDSQVDDALDRRVAQVFDRLLALSPRLNEDGQEEPACLGLSQAAKAAWVDFYNRHAERQADASGPEAAILAKIEGTAARLALVRYLTRQAAGEDVGNAINEEDVVAGVELAEWYADEAVRVAGVLNESDDDRLRRHVVEFIRRRGGAITANDLRRRSRQFRTSEEAERVLDDLVRSGAGVWDTPEHGDAGGRPTRVFRLSDSVSVSETQKTTTPGEVSDTGGAGSATGDDHDQTSRPDDQAGSVSETPAKPERNEVWDTDTEETPESDVFEEIVL